MDVKKVLLLLVITTLLFGSAYAAKDVNDFTVDKDYANVYHGSYYSVYMNGKQDSGITVYKNVDDDVYDDTQNDDAFDHIIHDDGREYVTPDDDMKIDQNADNTCNFKDYDHAEHGVSEIVKSGNEEFVVVFWAKDNSNIKDSDLTSLLNEFNKDNNVEAIAL